MAAVATAGYGGFSPKVLDLLKRALAAKPASSHVQLRLADNLYEFGDRKAAAEIYAALVEQAYILHGFIESVLGLAGKSE